MRTLKNSIKLSDEYYFELDPKLIKSNAKEKIYLGWEFAQGRIKSKCLNKILPKNNIHFFPVSSTNLQESCFLKNFEFFRNNFAHYQNSHILIDWPEEIQAILPQLKKSFPHCITLTSEQQLTNMEKIKTIDNLIENINIDPILFLESTDLRRYFLTIFKEKFTQINCVGSIESYLQYQLYNQAVDKNPMKPEFIVTGGITTWIQYQLENYACDDILQIKKLKEIGEHIFKNIITYILSHQTENILIICGYKTLNLIANYFSKVNTLSDLEQYNENNISYLKAKNNVNFVLSQPSNQTFLEYINVPGFFIKDLLKQDNSIDSWLDFAKKSYSAAFLRVCNQYNNWTKLDINPSQERDFFRFSYRLAQDRNMLFPSIFDMLLAATAVIDSNFSFELMKECKDFPENPLLSGTLPELHLPLSHFFKHTEKVSIQKFETIQSNKKFKKAKLKSVDKINQNKNITPVSEEKYADNSWVHEDHPYSCSFPSEDIFMEKLALNIKKNMSDKLKSQEITHHELKTDFCEGLDIRETIRNWHKEKIIIKELRHSGKPDIGTVIFNFADPTKDTNYSWRSFWLAEQHDDSNLMFYATPFKDNLIGPGIAKSEFGGFAVIPLPSTIENPWGNAYILHYARNATECLILAGALSTNHRSVLFISNHPPSQHISKIIKQSRKNIIYAKLDEFPQEDIRQVRTFHILAEAGVRNYAQKYIRKDS